MQNHLSLRARVFYLIRREDIELAETFARRCPEVRNVVELNTFFHQILSQLENCPYDARACLNDTMDVEDWIRHFTNTVLPVLRRLRFPPLTAKEVPSFYEAFDSRYAMA